jgi:hypothetical protein
MRLFFYAHKKPGTLLQRRRVLHSKKTFSFINFENLVFAIHRLTVC